MGGSGSGMPTKSERRNVNVRSTRCGLETTAEDVTGRRRGEEEGGERESE